MLIDGQLVPQEEPFTVDHIRVRSGCTCIVAGEFGNFKLRSRTGVGGGGAGGRVPAPGKREADRDSRERSVNNVMTAGHAPDEQVLLTNTGSFGAIVLPSPVAPGLQQLWKDEPARTEQQRRSE